ncbi:MAG: hypothetical protein KJZ85_11495 [Rhodobacteraceae bacterium]|jgi:Flp pilus assembly pilin Flp|nr:hypothetical protein [Paracoccaceae bacterium]
MLELLGRFARDEAGAVTIDWVVLCAAMVGIGVMMVSFVGTATSNLSSSTGGYISGIQVGFATD